MLGGRKIRSLPDKFRVKCVTIMEPKEHFDLVHSALVDGYKEYTANEARVTGFFPLAIGWFLARENPFPVLENLLYAWAAIVWLIGLIVVFIWVPILRLKKSKRRFFELSKLRLVDESAYRDYDLTKLQVGLSVFVHTSLQTSLLLMIHDRYIST